MKIYAEGKAEHIQDLEYQGNLTRQVQAIVKTEKKGFDIIKIKITDEILNFKVGDYVRIPIQLSAMDRKIFYRQDGKIEVIKGN